MWASRSCSISENGRHVRSVGDIRVAQLAAAEAMSVRVHFRVQEMH